MTKKFQKISAAAACAATLLLTGCATGPQKFAVSDHTIRSILVVPAVNETTSVDADNLMNAMSTYTLAEGGYYVFPMDTVKYVLEAEGLYEPERVRELGPEKLAQLFDSDSVLFIKILHWDATYAVLNTQTKIIAEYSFFKADGTPIWSDKVTVAYNSNQNNSGGGLIGLIVEATVAAVNRAAPDYRIAAKQINTFAVRNWEPGPYRRVNAQKH